MKVKIELAHGYQLVDITGNPLKLLLEFTCFMERHEDLAHILKHALKLAEIAKKDENLKNGKLVYEGTHSSEGSKIIDEFMKRYKTDKFDVNKN